MLSIEDFEIKRKAESEIELKQRRERIATALMAGLIREKSITNSEKIECSIRLTDALIKALDEVKE